MPRRRAPIDGKLINSARFSVTEAFHCNTGASQREKEVARQSKSFCEAEESPEQAISFQEPCDTENSKKDGCNPDRQEGVGLGVAGRTGISTPRFFRL